MVERIVSMDRRIGILVILVLTTLFFGCTAWAVSAFVGGDDNGAGEEIPAGAEDWMAPLPGGEVDTLGNPIPQTSLIAMNPLDLESERDPYLTPAELDYFRSMGPHLWAYVRVWLHVKRIISVDVSSWQLASLSYDLDLAQAFPESGLTGVRDAVVRRDLSERRLLTSRSIPAQGEDSPPCGGDILREERARRLRRRSGLRRIFAGSLFTGWRRLAFLLAFLVVGAGWLGYQRLESSALLGGPGSPQSPAEPVEDAGRDLTAGEQALAARYGRPLWLGPSGRPLVFNEETEEVRELTPFKMEFEGSFRVRGSSRGSVIEVPGRRSYGMWWRSGAEEVSLRPRLSFHRSAWRDKQEAELSRMYHAVLIGLRIVNEVDLEAWNRGLSLPLTELVTKFKRPYPPAAHGHWGHVPDTWLCDHSLELDLNQGLSVGCPGEEYRAALRNSWVLGGVVMERMEGVARALMVLDGWGRRISG